MTLYIYSPVVGPTGGTELLQQFCYIARLQGVDAKILYQKDPTGSPILQKFGFYNNSYSTHFEDTPENAILIPEHYAEKIARVKKARAAIWWMSVDNYWGASYQPDGYSYRDVYRVARRVLYRPVHRRNIALFKRCYHFYQSEYARLYLRKDLGVSETKTWSLTDYIDRRYCEDSNRQKRNTVLYNPKKGIKYTRQLVDAAPDIEWLPLEGYSIDELISVMQGAKLYIDFGAHPGKDRLPREAAACGCCILTGTRGAAKNDVDIPLDRQYKIDQFDIPTVIERVRYLLFHYEEEHAKLDAYRRQIVGEKEAFEQEVRQAASLLLDQS